MRNGREWRRKKGQNGRRSEEKEKRRNGNERVRAYWAMTSVPMRGKEVER